MRQHGIAGLWNFASYFTVLVNLLVACVASAVWLRPSARLARPRRDSGRVHASLARGQHSGLRWRQIGWVLPAPLGYFAYAMARGAIDGWVRVLVPRSEARDPWRMAASIAALWLAMLAIGAALVGIDRLLTRRARAGSA